MFKLIRTNMSVYFRNLVKQKNKIMIKKTFSNIEQQLNLHARNFATILNCSKIKTSAKNNANKFPCLILYHHATTYSRNLNSKIKNQNKKYNQKKRVYFCNDNHVFTLIFEIFTFKIKFKIESLFIIFFLLATITTFLRYE